MYLKRYEFSFLLYLSLLLRPIPLYSSIHFLAHSLTQSGLPKGSTEKSVKALFNRFGKIISVLPASLLKYAAIENYESSVKNSSQELLSNLSIEDTEAYTSVFIEFKKKPSAKETLNRLSAYFKSIPEHTEGKNRSVVQSSPSLSPMSSPASSPLSPSPLSPLSSAFIPLSLTTTTSDNLSVTLLDLNDSNVSNSNIANTAECKIDNNDSTVGAPDKSTTPETKSPTEAEVAPAPALSASSSAPMPASAPASAPSPPALVGASPNPAAEKDADLSDFIGLTISAKYTYLKKMGYAKRNSVVSPATTPLQKPIPMPVPAPVPEQPRRSMRNWRLNANSAEDLEEPASALFRGDGSYSPSGTQSRSRSASVNSPTGGRPRSGSDAERRRSSFGKKGVIYANMSISYTANPLKGKDPVPVRSSRKKLMLRKKTSLIVKQRYAKGPEAGSIGFGGRRNAGSPRSSPSLSPSSPKSSSPVASPLPSASLASSPSPSPPPAAI